MVIYFYYYFLFSFGIKFGADFYNLLKKYGKNGNVFKKCQSYS